MGFMQKQIEKWQKISINGEIIHRSIRGRKTERATARRLSLAGTCGKNGGKIK